MGTCCSKDSLAESIPRNAPIDCTAVAASTSPIICLTGGPGAGKDTIGKRLARNFGFLEISASALIRAEVNSNTERGEIMKKIINHGHNLPADVIVQKIAEKMAASPNVSGYLIIGFPRDKQQAILFNKDIRQPSLCIYLWARKQVLEERMRTRVLEGVRFDDTDPILMARIKTFFNNIGGAVSVYKKFTRHVDAEKSEEEIYQLASVAVEAMRAKLNT